MGIIDWLSDIFTTPSSRSKEKDRSREDEEEEEIEELIALDIL